VGSSPFCNKVVLNLGSYSVQPERMNFQLVVKFFAAAKVYLMEMHGFVFYNFVSKSIDRVKKKRNCLFYQHHGTTLAVH
jgi:hypothetical protein